MEIRKQAGIAALINILSLSEDSETVKHCIRALSILSIDGENRESIQNGGLLPVIQCLRSKDVETRRSAMGCLINLSINPTTKEQIRILGGMPEIVKCLSSTDVETVRYSLRTLCNLSFNGKKRMVFI